MSPISDLGNDKLQQALVNTNVIQPNSTIFVPYGLRGTIDRAAEFLGSFTRPQLMMLLEILRQRPFDINSLVSAFATTRADHLHLLSRVVAAMALSSNIR